MRLLIISHPFPWSSGAGKRNFEVLNHFAECGHEVTLVFSPFTMKWLVYSLKTRKKDLDCFFRYTSELERRGIVIHPGCMRYISDLFSSDTDTARARKKLFLGSMVFHGSFISHMVSGYAGKYLEDLNGPFDIVYAHHETLDAAMLAYRLSGKLNVPFVFLLHSEPYKPLSTLVKNKKFVSIAEYAYWLAANLFPNYSTGLFYRKAMNSPLFRGLLAISPSPLIISGLSGIHHKILNPSNAVDPSLLRNRENPAGKEQYAVFFSRFSQEKGIFEIPFIWKGVAREIPGAKLLLYGIASEFNLTRYRSLVQGLSMDDLLMYRGYTQDTQELHDTVRRAKVMVHPSHSDGFSLSILESLAAGTPVVAYAIPALGYYYGKFRAVRLVREGDIAAMSAAIADVMTHYEKYQEALEDEDLREFLHRHDSWKNVAQAELESLASL